MSKQDNTSIVNFNFDALGIRVVDKDGTAWFVARDVAKAIGIGRTQLKEHVSALESDERGAVKVATLGGMQEHTIISEPGLYSILLAVRYKASLSKTVKRFRRWVTHEVIPAIRKTGSYSIESADQLELLVKNADNIAKVAHVLLEERNERMKLDARLSKLECVQQTALEKLKSVPKSLIPVTPKTVRAEISELVRAYCHATGVAYQDVWRKIYREFKYRHHIDVDIRSKNATVKTGKTVSKIEIAEQMGKLPELFAVATHVCK